MVGIFDKPTLRRGCSLVAVNLHQLQVNRLLWYIFKLQCKSICRLTSAMPLPGAHNQETESYLSDWVNLLQLGAELESLHCHLVLISLILLNFYSLGFRHWQVFVSPGTVEWRYSCFLLQICSVVNTAAELMFSRVTEFSLEPLSSAFHKLLFISQG